MPFVSSPPTRRRRPDKPTRTPLTRERIVDATLAVVGAGGLGALTMRAVAARLGTGPASLYAHVADREELLELALERVLGALPLPEPDPEHWQEQLKEMARDAHRALLAHGELARAALEVVALGEGALRRRHRMIELLRLGGLPDRVVAHGVDLLPQYAAAAAFERALVSDAERARYAREVREFLASLPGAPAPVEAGERFEFGLDVLVAGLAAYGRRANTA